MRREFYINGVIKLLIGPFDGLDISRMEEVSAEFFILTQLLKNSAIEAYLLDLIGFDLFVPENMIHDKYNHPIIFIDENGFLAGVRNI